MRPFTRRLAIVVVLAGGLAVISVWGPLEGHDTLGGAVLLFSPALLAVLALLPAPRRGPYAALSAGGAAGVALVVAIGNEQSNDDNVTAVVFFGTLVSIWVAAALVALFVWLVLRIVVPGFVGRRRGPRGIEPPAD